MRMWGRGGQFGGGGGAAGKPRGECPHCRARVLEMVILGSSLRPASSREASRERESYEPLILELHTWNTGQGSPVPVSQRRLGSGLTQASRVGCLMQISDCLSSWDRRHIHRLNAGLSWAWIPRKQISDILGRWNMRKLVTGVGWLRGPQAHLSPGCVVSIQLPFERLQWWGASHLYPMPEVSRPRPLELKQTYLYAASQKCSHLQFQLTLFLNFQKIQYEIKSKIHFDVMGATFQRIWV